MCIIIVAKFGHIEGKLAIDRTQEEGNQMSPCASPPLTSRSSMPGRRWKPCGLEQDCYRANNSLEWTRLRRATQLQR